MISRRRHDQRHNFGEKIIALSHCGLIAVVGDAVISKPAAQNAVHVVELVGRDPVVTTNGIVRKVVQEVGERIDILGLRVGEKCHRVVLYGIVILRGAVVGIDRSAGTGGAVRGAGAIFQIFLIILPGNAGAIELGREMRRGEDVAGTGAGIIIRLNAKIRSRFRPDITWFGGMDTDTGIVIMRGVGNLRGIGIAGRHEAIDEGRSGIAENLLRAGTRRRLRPVVILHGNHKHRLDGGQRGGNLRVGNADIDHARSGGSAEIIRSHCCQHVGSSGNTRPGEVVGSQGNIGQLSHPLVEGHIRDHAIHIRRRDHQRQSGW